MPDFIPDPDIESIAKKLIAIYPDLLKNIDSSKLIYVREISASQRNTVGACVHVFPPYNFLNPNIKYIIAIYFRSSWDTLTEAQRSALIMHQLLHIPDDMEGSPLMHNVQDFNTLVDNFGSDYLNRSDLPNLLDREEGKVSKPVEDGSGSVG